MSGLAGLLNQATPGPWVVVDYTDDFREPARFVGFGANQGGFAFEQDSTLLTEADARLVALAPEMAALLIDAMDALRGITEYESLHGRDYGLDHSKALLARFAELERKAAQRAPGCDRIIEAIPPPGISKEQEKEER